MTPVSTSPVPAVASALLPVGLMCTVFPSQISVSEPLSSVVTPVRSTNSRMRATRVPEAIEPRPESRANSPAWGVTTTGLPRNNSKCLLR